MHFYEAGTGAPRYEVEYAGKRKGTRPATLRDAKKHGWYPSVTTILDCLDKPALNAWREGQAVMATYGREKLGDETWPQFIRRCRSAADEVRDKAADDGSMLHDYIEQALAGNPVHPEKWEETVQAAQAYLRELRPEGEWVIEQSFGVEGFGGRVDAYHAGTEDLYPVVLDWKTKEFTSDDVAAGKVRAYPNHLWQLAAYAYGLSLGVDKTVGVNVFVSRTEPGLIHPVHWTQLDMMRGWSQFKAIRDCYFAVKEYFPYEDRD